MPKLTFRMLATRGGTILEQADFEAPIPSEDQETMRRYVAKKWGEGITVEFGQGLLTDDDLAFLADLERFVATERQSAT